MQPPGVAAARTMYGRQFADQRAVIRLNSRAVATARSGGSPSGDGDARAQVRAAIVMGLSPVSDHTRNIVVDHDRSYCGTVDRGHGAVMAIQTIRSVRPNAALIDEPAP